MCPWISVRNEVTYFEEVPLPIIAEDYGTPCYVYSSKAITDSFQAYQQALNAYQHLICYSVKANSNISILKKIASLGAGFDIVSEGELQRVLIAGGSPDKIIFSGVGKTQQEIEKALRVNIHCFNVESVAELYMIQEIAQRLNCQAPVAMRVNTNIDPKTHPYIATGLKDHKFGIPIEETVAIYQQASTLTHIQLIGIDFHIGSQLLDQQPLLESIKQIKQIIDQLTQQGIHLQHIDLGGGIGIVYKDEQPIELNAFFKAVHTQLMHDNLKIIVEPGRFIVGNAGILLTTVLLTKNNQDKNFVVVDAAMNDMMRVALYDAWHDIKPVICKIDQEQHNKKVDIVGPVCETSDTFAVDRALSAVKDDLLYVKSVGAYGFVMSSNYNSRGRAAEVLVDENNTYLIRKRETIEDQLTHELPYLR